MYSVILSSRHDPGPDSPPPLDDFLTSFADLTTDEEKSKSEFLLKFDSDDPHIPSEKQLNSFGIKVKKFVWERYAGRGSLHEVQNSLYKFVHPECKFVQFAADDFVFTRSNFVTEILEHSNTYTMGGAPGGGGYKLMGDQHWAPEGTGGYMPAISTKILDAWGGTTGPHAETDGVAKDVASYLRDVYDYEVMFAPGNDEKYYCRNEQRSRLSDGVHADINNSFAIHSHPPGEATSSAADFTDTLSYAGTPDQQYRLFDSRIWKLLGDNIIKCMCADAINNDLVELYNSQKHAIQ